MIRVSACARIVTESANAARINAKTRAWMDLELAMCRHYCPAVAALLDNPLSNDSTDPAWSSERPCRQPQFARRCGDRRAGERLSGRSAGQRADRLALEQAERR